MNFDLFLIFKHFLNILNAPLSGLSWKTEIYVTEGIKKDQIGQRPLACLSCCPPFVNWIRDFFLRKKIYSWYKLEVAIFCKRVQNVWELKMFISIDVPLMFNKTDVKCAWISNTIDWEYSSNLSLMSISSYVVQSTKETGI